MKKYRVKLMERDPPPSRDDPMSIETSGAVFARGGSRAYTPPDEEEENESHDPPEDGFCPS